MFCDEMIISKVLGLGNLLVLLHELLDRLHDTIKNHAAIDFSWKHTYTTNTFNVANKSFSIARKLEVIKDLRLRES